MPPAIRLIRARLSVTLSCWGQLSRDWRRWCARAVFRRSAFRRTKLSGGSTRVFRLSANSFDFRAHDIGPFHGQEMRGVRNLDEPCTPMTACDDLHILF